MMAGLRMVGAAAAMMIAMAASAANAPPPTALRALETGEWELRERGTDGEARKLCVTDARLLLQVRHARNSCKSFVVSDTARAVTVTYDCATAGNGRTALRVETARLVQIDSQGVADGAPFAFAMEGRRIGACH